MPTYVYETLPKRKGDPVERFEIWQSMKEDPLTTHPETGVPIRRVLIGGIGAPESIVDTSDKKRRDQTVVRWNTTFIGFFGLQTADSGQHRTER